MSEISKLDITRLEPTQDISSNLVLNPALFETNLFTQESVNEEIQNATPAAVAPTPIVPIEVTLYEFNFKTNTTYPDWKYLTITTVNGNEVKTESDIPTTDITPNGLKFTQILGNKRYLRCISQVLEGEVLTPDDYFELRLNYQGADGNPAKINITLNLRVIFSDPATMEKYVLRPLIKDELNTIVFRLALTGVLRVGADRVPFDMVFADSDTNLDSYFIERIRIYRTTNAVPIIVPEPDPNITVLTLRDGILSNFSNGGLTFFDGVIELPLRDGILSNFSNGGLNFHIVTGSQGVVLTLRDGILSNFSNGGLTFFDGVIELPLREGILSNFSNGGLNIYNQT